MRRAAALWAVWLAGFIAGATLAFTRRDDVQEEELAPGVWGSPAGLRIVRDDEETR